MGVTKVISKTKRKIRNTTSAVGNTVVDGAVGTVAGGAGLVGGAAKLGANGVLAGVGTVAHAAQFGVSTATSGVGMGVDALLTGATTGATIATMGVGAVGAVGELGLGVVGTGLGAVGTGVGAVTHAISGGALTHGHRRGAVDGNVNELEIYCSDLYTVEFVLEEFSKCKKARVIDTLTIEDLLLRNDERLNKAAVNLVYKTTLPPKDEFDLEDDEVLPRTPYERAWQSMTFCECITSAEDYQIYTENKNEFQVDLRKVLKKRGVNKMPIRFMAKVEIAMIDMNEMIDLLHEIENDKTIIDVKFPDFCKDIRKLPSALANRFDEETLDWKDDAEPVEIHIKYGSKPPRKDGKKKRSTMLVRQCSLKLEHIVMNSSKCFDDDDDSYFAMGSAASLPML